MRPELQHLERIEAFLEGQLNAQEAAEFQAEIDADPALKAEVQLQRELVERLNHHALVQTIKGVQLEVENEGKKRPGYWRSFWIIALLVVVSAIGIATLYDSTFSNPSLSEETAPKTKSIELLETPPVVQEGAPLPSPDSNRTKTIPPQPARKADLPNNLQVPFTSFKFNAAQGADLQTSQSGTVLHIPANALLDAKGKLVQGEVELQYREFRDAADMAFSGIPMTYNQNGTPHNFNSAGMFEVNASQNGKPLSIQAESPITVDFELTESLPDLDFYQLNPSGTEWKQLQPIEVSDMTVMVSQTPDSISLDAFIKMEPILMSTNFNGRLGKQIDWEEIPLKNLMPIRRKMTYPKMAQDAEITGYVDLTIMVGRDGNLRNASIQYASHPLFRKAVIEAVKDLPPLSLPTKDGKSGPYNFVLPIDFFPEGGRNPRLDAQPPSVNSSNQTSTNPNNLPLVSDTSLPVSNINGNIVPNLAYGLQASSFGVYNCDQIRRIRNRIQVFPTFYDETGNRISNVASISLVDLRLNAAFSFSPQQPFYCEPEGRNIVMITTNNGQVFGINEKAFSEIGIARTRYYSLRMENISQKVQDLEGLRKYLGLDQQ